MTPRRHALFPTALGVCGVAWRGGGFSGGDGRRLKLAILNVERAQVGGATGLFDHLPPAVRA